MNRVEIVNLAGRAHHIDADGVAELDGWLRHASLNLDGDPDRAELLADFEQVIGEKLAHARGSHRDVATAADVSAVLASIGPVVAADGVTADPAEQQHATPAPEYAPGVAGPNAGVRRLYRIEQGQLLAGVSTGIAAYLRVDVNVVRAAWILLALLSSGAALVAYVVMAVFVPVADTADERAAAHGRLATAQDLMERTRTAAEPALASLGRVLGSVGRALAGATLVLSLVAMAIVVVTWVAVTTSVLGGAEWITSAFDPDVDRWVVALWTTCLAWVVMAPLVAIVASIRALHARADGRPARRSLIGVAVVAATLWVAATVGALVLPYSHSAQVRDVVDDGQGRVRMFDETVCFEREGVEPTAAERCRTGDERETVD